MSHREQMWAPWLGFCPRRLAFNALWARVLWKVCAWPGRGQKAEAACGFGHPTLQGRGAVGRKMGPRWPGLTTWGLLLLRVPRPRACQGRAAGLSVAVGC